MSWTRNPLLHFVAGGAILFWIAPRVFPAAGGGPPTPPIVITSTHVAELRAAYTQETGLQATPADEAALVEKAIDEELLFREAVARGLDRHDRSVRNWLIAQMRALTEDADGDPEVLYAGALALELDRKDLVVRRMLVQKMRLLASRAGEEDVTDDELRAFYALRQAAYRLPDRVSFWHVFLASHRDGDGGRPEAARLLAELRGRPADPAAAVRLGDSFPLPAHLVTQSRAQIAKLFGASFADEVMRGAPRSWLGPLASPYGTHLVWIEEQVGSAPPAFDAVRGRVLEAWHEERRARRLAEFVRALKQRYPLRVESAAWHDRRGA